MAVVTATSKSSLSPITPVAVVLATSGDTLAYAPNVGQELWLFNTSEDDVDVVIDGNVGTVVVIPGAAGLTASVAAGLTVVVGANSFATVMLDKAQAYLRGNVAITAAVGGVVKATIVAP
jgi:hypothetical protein